MDDHEQRAHPASLLLAPAAIFIGLAAGLVVTIVIQAVGHSFGSPIDHPTPAVNLVADYMFDFCFVGAALYLVVLRRTASGRGVMSAQELGYRRIKLWVGALAVLLAGGVYFGGTWLYSQLVTIKGVDKLPSELNITHSTAAAIATTVFVCVVAPICEEFFFRGFLFTVLRQMRVRLFGRDYGTLIAALIVALLFGLAHTESAKPEYLIPLGFLGFMLCLVRWVTKSLYPCMVIHSVNNAVALGVNELHWGAGWIVLVAAGSLGSIALLTAPLSRRKPAASVSGA